MEGELEKQKKKIQSQKIKIASFAGMLEKFQKQSMDTKKYMKVIRNSLENVEVMVTDLQMKCKKLQGAPPEEFEPQVFWQDESSAAAELAKWKLEQQMSGEERGVGVKNLRFMKELDEDIQKILRVVKETRVMAGRVSESASRKKSRTRSVGTNTEEPYQGPGEFEEPHQGLGEFDPIAGIWTDEAQKKQRRKRPRKEVKSVSDIDITILQVKKPKPRTRKTVFSESRSSPEPYQRPTITMTEIKEEVVEETPDLGVGSGPSYSSTAQPEPVPGWLQMQTGTVPDSKINGVLFPSSIRSLVPGQQQSIPLRSSASFSLFEIAPLCPPYSPASNSTLSEDVYPIRKSTFRENHPLPYQLSSSSSSTSVVILSSGEENSQANPKAMERSQKHRKYNIIIKPKPGENDLNSSQLLLDNSQSEWPPSTQTPTQQPSYGPPHPLHHNASFILGQSQMPTTQQGSRSHTHRRSSCIREEFFSLDENEDEVA